MDRDSVDELKRHFNVVAEALRSEIRVVSEGVQGLREETSREFKAVRGEIAEAQAMIRISFGQLDQRIRTLEENMVTLRSRLDRLEAGHKPS